MKRISCKKQITFEKLVLGVIYIIPLIYYDQYGLLIYLSMFSAIFFINRDKKENDSVNLRKVNELLILIGFIAMAYALIYLYYVGYMASKPYVYILFYLLSPFFALYFLDIPWIKKMFQINLLILKDTFKLCWPLIFISVQWSILSIEVYNLKDIIYNLYQCIIIAAIPEEIFFRGFLYRRFKTIINAYAAKIVTSLVFAFWHITLVMGYLNFKDVSSLINLISIFVLGYLCCELIDRYESVFPCIVIHAGINGMFRYITYLFLI